MALAHRTRRSLAELATLVYAQFGLFTRAQALSRGFTNRWLQRQIDSGLFIREYPDIYRFAAVPQSFHQKLMAVCLRAPGKIWVSHRAAGAFWDLDDVSPNVIEVTSLVGMRIDPSKVVLHRTKEMPGQDVTTQPLKHGSRVTTNGGAAQGGAPSARLGGLGGRRPLGRSRTTPPCRPPCCAPTGLTNDPPAPGRAPRCSKLTDAAEWVWRPRRR